ncbi:MAG: HAD family acid phosphatase, partial [Ignavibacteriaceae bacterium]
MKKLSLYTIVLVIVSLSFNCSPSHELINLSKAKNAVIKYHASGEYDNDLLMAVNEAEDKFAEITFTGSSAVVFDVDETALSNYEINKQLDFGYVVSEWNKWIEEARAPAIEPVKNLYDFLLTKGSKIIFITGRTSEQYEATIKNLHSEGYTAFDTLITRSKDEKELTAVEYKSSKRTELTGKGYKI